MAKQFGTCALCGANHFLNHAGLCKRCSASPKSKAIKAEVLQHEAEAEEFKHEAAEAAAAEAAEAAATAEETTEETTKEGKEEGKEAEKKEEKKH